MGLMNKQLCVFDLDGTLVNTLGDLAAALNMALQSRGMPALPDHRVCAIVGHSTQYMFQHAVPEDRYDEWEDVGKAYDAVYAKHCCDTSRPYEGVLRMLGRLKKAGLKLAVVSNKPHRDTLTVVRTLFPRDSFHLVLGRMDRFATKPAPGPLNFVLEYFGVPPAGAVYVGDSEVDVAFAANAGVACLSTAWGFRTRQELLDAGAAKILDDPQEVADILLNG